MRKYDLYFRNSERVIKKISLCANYFDALTILTYMTFGYSSEKHFPVYAELYEDGTRLAFYESKAR